MATSDPLGRYGRTPIAISGADAVRPRNMVPRLRKAVPAVELNPEGNVRKTKQLSSAFVAVFAVAALVGTSAFAEDRPRNETRSRGNAGGVVNRRGAGESRDWRGGNGSQNAAPRVAEQQREAAVRGTSERSGSNRGTWNRTEAGSTTNIDRERSRSNAAESYRNDRNNSGRNDSYRNGNRNDGYRNGRNDSYRNGSRNDGYRNGSYNRGNRTPYYAHGRVTRIDPWNGGFRIYVAGAPFPFFVSDSYYRRNHWRVGVSIQLGGYYNPLGYYDYYDGVYDGGAYSAGAIRGTVESVDYRRDTFVVRNDATGSFVTVAARSRRDEVRPGDYVEIAGDWNRSGIFDAYRIDLLDAYRR
jgi:hypothetical protein